MTNFEYYKDVILAIDGGVAVVNTTGKARECSGLSCDDCAFSRKNSGENCDKAFRKWLYAEHIEKPTLTTFEHDFCKGANEGYIARNSNGLLYYYTETPKKDYSSWSGGRFVDIHKIKSLNFDFIKWEDEKAWSVEDLLQLAVK